MLHQPMPIEAQILPQIQQAAEKNQLGTPLAIYKKRGIKSAGKAAQKALTLGVAILILPQIFLLGLELSVNGTWIWIIGILLTLSLLIGVSSYRSAMRHRFDQVVMYAEGFVYLNGSLLPVTRWEQIAKVWRGTKVHPEGGEAGLGDVDILRLQKFDGTEFELTTGWEKHDRAVLCDTVESEFVCVALPRTLEDYRSGKNTYFGTLMVNRTALNDGKEELPWGRVAKIEVSSDYVTIRKEGRTSDWFRALIPDVPNACLLKELLGYIRK